MIDKQIIIDGVDVSRCEFCDYKGSDIPQCRIRQVSFEPTCKGYNCYYKQLKREEKGNEKYQQTLAEIKEIAENVIKNVSDRCIETTPMYGVHKEILQKISECEVIENKN